MVEQRKAGRQKSLASAEPGVLDFASSGTLTHQPTKEEETQAAAGPAAPLATGRLVCEGVFVGHGAEVVVADRGLQQPAWLGPKNAGIPGPSNYPASLEEGNDSAGAERLLCCRPAYCY